MSHFNSIPADTQSIYADFVSGYREQINQMRIPFTITSQHVARAVIHALTNKVPWTRYKVGVDAWLLFLLRSILPERVMVAFFAFICDKLSTSS